MMRSFIVFSAFALLLSACGPSGEEISPVTGDTEALSGAPESLIGSWRSPSCEKRTYERKLQFDKSESFEAQDLVSPCPPDVVCFWSGVVHRAGTYAVVDEKIKLVVREPRTSSLGQPFPTELVIDPATSAPVEISPTGEACKYVRDAEMPRTPDR
jgi:hypothetical protein